VSGGIYLLLWPRGPACRAEGFEWREAQGPAVPGADRDGQTCRFVSEFVLRSEGRELPATDTVTVDDGYTATGWPYGDARAPGPPLAATGTLAATDGTTYTESAELVVNT